MDKLMGVKYSYGWANEYGCTDKMYRWIDEWMSWWLDGMDAWMTI